jgi:hypothetical protein
MADLKRQTGTRRNQRTQRDAFFQIEAAIVLMAISIAALLFFGVITAVSLLNTQREITAVDSYLFSRVNYLEQYCSKFAALPYSNTFDTTLWGKTATVAESCAQVGNLIKVSVDLTYPGLGAQSLTEYYLPPK